MHTSIVVGFVLFTIFVAEPLFDRLETLPNESKIQQLSVPPETGDIKYSFHLPSFDEHLIEIEGWAFIESQGSRDSEIYIVMRSDTNTYVFDTFTIRRDDIFVQFRDDLEMDRWAGFLSRIPVRKIENGEYIAGIYIKKGDIEALQHIMTDKVIVKAGINVELTVRMSEVQEIPLSPEFGEIRVGVDRCEVMKEENEKALVEIAGWAFIEGQSADDSKIYVVLKSEGATYIFDTFLQKRPGVTAYFVESGLNLDNSGFIARIATDSVEEGVYKLGIYIKKGDIEAMQYIMTDKVIVKAGNIAKLTVPMSEVQGISLPPESGEIRLAIDVHEVIEEENERKFMKMTGWAFIEGQSAEDSKIYVVLKSEGATYIFDTFLQKRPDVTAHFVESGLNLDNSGFIARIPVDTVKVGTYKLGIYIKKGDIKALQYTGRVVEF